MAFNSFVVYETVGRRVRYLRPTHAQASADVGADADLSTHVAAVSTPDWVLPGHYFNPADLSFTADPVLTGLDLLKSKARFTHNRMGYWTTLLEASALTHSSAHVNYGHDILFRGHQGMYIVCHRTADEYTIAHRITYCEQMAIGASNVTTIQEFFEHVHDLAATSPLTGPVTWVDPMNNMRILFSEIPGTAANDFDSMQAGNAPPGPDVLREGAWIEDLAA